MKKIMFSDKLGLTQAVLEGRKTQTRRIITLTLHKETDVGNNLIEVYPSKVFFEDGKWKFEYDGYVFLLPKENYPRYNVGEAVAVAQSYKECLAENPYNRAYFLNGSSGWNNKMFVCADLMPHQIRITDVRVERLQDISDEDCWKEGIEKINMSLEQEDYRYCFYDNMKELWNKYRTPQEAFAYLIIKVSRKDLLI